MEDGARASPCTPATRFFGRPEFRDRFASGYRAAGGALADGWWPAARLLDAARLVDTLSEARELPAVFAECRDLVASMLGGGEPAAA